MINDLDRLIAMKQKELEEAEKEYQPYMALVPLDNEYSL